MKFGQRIQDEAPPELASVMFRYTVRFTTS